MADKFQREEVLRDFNPISGEFENFKFGANAVTGWRLDQEDCYTCLPSPNFVKNYSFFGIYDGHGGFEVAEYLKKKLYEHIKDCINIYDDVETAFREGFKACDSSLRSMKEEELDDIRKDRIKSFRFEDIKLPGNEETKDELRREMLRQIEKELMVIQTRIFQATAAATSGKSNVGKKGDQESKKDEKDQTQVAASSSGLRRTVRKKTGSLKASKEETEEDKGASSSSFSKSAESKEKKSEEDVNTPAVGLACGSTATAVVFTDDRIYVANVGDSRCIVSVNGNMRILTHDHRPYHKLERERINSSGHKILKQRVDGGLNMSRAFGDFGLKDQSHLAPEKQAIIADPTTISIANSPNIDFLIIASDGIWNNISNDVIAHHVNATDDDDDVPLPDVCANIINEILSKDKTEQILDNITLIIIKRSKKTNNKHGTKEKKVIKNKKMKEAEESTKSSKKIKK